MVAVQRKRWEINWVSSFLPLPSIIKQLHLVFMAINYALHMERVSTHKFYLCQIMFWDFLKKAKWENWNEFWSQKSLCGPWCCQWYLSEEILENNLLSWSLGFLRKTAGSNKKVVIFVFRGFYEIKWVHFSGNTWKHKALKIWKIFGKW